MDEENKKDLQNAVIDALREAKEGIESTKNNKKTCACKTPLCAKCLSSNCQNKDCPVHTKQAKEEWRSQWEKAHKKPFPHPVNY
jgi:hypothetical protein